MGRVLMIGRNDDKDLIETERILSHFGVKTRTFSGEEQFFGIDTVIFVNTEASSETLRLPRECIGIAADDDLTALNVLKNSGCSTVTCGFSSACTVTLSGIDGDRAAVGLQRDLVSVDGRTVEAREIPVTFCGIENPFALMAAVAAALIEDKQIVN